MYSRLTQIDESTMGDHYYLDGDDSCYYMGEYTARRGYTFSGTNQLIFNFKKSVDRRGRPEWRHKINAINTVATSLHTVMGTSAANATFVPVPPSKAKNDDLYDDRLLQVLSGYKALNGDVDFRELITQTASTDSAHDDNRLSPDDYSKLYTIDNSLTQGVRQDILILDDVITTGSHYKAMQNTLQNQFPGHRIHGVFIARRAPDTEILF